MIDAALLDKVISEAMALVKKGEPVGAALSRTWSKYQIPNVLYDESRKEAERQILKELGMRAIREAGGVSKAYTKIMPVKTVKTQITKASARARVDIEREMKTVIKKGEAAGAAAARIIAAPSSAAYADVRSSIKTLTDGIDKKAADKLRLQIRGLKTGNLKASYQEAIKAAEKGIPGAVEKQMKFVAMDKARYNMQRVIRTESKRAIAAANVEKIASDPLVKLVRFKLSTGHVHDICDAYANADMGYGPGVYTLSAAPSLPIHPNGQSRLIPVYLVPKGGKETMSAEKALANAGAKNVSLIDIKRRL